MKVDLAEAPLAWTGEVFRAVKNKSAESEEIEEKMRVLSFFGESVFKNCDLHKCQVETDSFLCGTNHTTLIVTACDIIKRHYQIITG